MTPVQAARLAKSLEPYELFWLEYASQYQIKSGMHGPTDISPVGVAAATHLGLAIHNVGIQEYMKHGAKTHQTFEHSFTWHDGILHPRETPGIGVELNVDEASKYPYVQAYLPYNRLADSTVQTRGGRPSLRRADLAGRDGGAGGRARSLRLPTQP